MAGGLDARCSRFSTGTSRKRRPHSGTLRWLLCLRWHPRQGAKDAKNLNEKVRSLSDRIALVEAKCKELESFFTNQVWEFSNLDDAPLDRVLKAHFILKFFYHHAKYLAKVKPITITKERVNSPDLLITEGERTQLRAAIGAIPWAATQTSPHLQAHTSYLAGDINSASVATLLEANKMLRFAQANSDMGLESLSDPWTSSRWSRFRTLLWPAGKVLQAEEAFRYPLSIRPLWRPAPPASTTSLTGGASSWHQWRDLLSLLKDKLLRKPRTPTCSPPPS